MIAPECPVCMAPDACRHSECDPNRGYCVERPVEDGTACRDGTSICVAGVCTLRGCGDGYREPGPEPAREGCDDGNLRDGDLCSSNCIAEVHVVDADDGNDYDAYAPLPGPSAGIDGDGRYLIVWLQNHFGSETLVARRFDRFLAPFGSATGPGTDGGSLPIEPELLVLDAELGAPSNAAPVVAGLSGGGWVVAWTVLRFGSREIAYRIVGADGTVGALRIANQQQIDSQSAPQAIAWGTGFLLGWSSAYVSPSVRIRQFRSDGTAFANEASPSPTKTGSQSELRLTRSGNSYLALWVNQSSSENSSPMLRGVRFDAHGAIDAAPIEITTEGATQPTVAGFGDGSFAMAWRTATADLQGDVKMRMLAAGWPATLTDVENVAVTPGYAEEHPSVGALPGGAVVVAWDDGFPPQPVFAMSEGATAGGAELAWLDLWVSVHADSNLSTLYTPRGVLFLWEGSSPDHYGGALSAFLLPFD